MAVKRVSVRFEKEMLDKISYVADYEGRSINSQILVLVRNYISQFEKEHGKIEVHVKPDVNVRPADK